MILTLRNNGKRDITMSSIKKEEISESDNYIYIEIKDKCPCCLKEFEKDDN